MEILGYNINISKRFKGEKKPNELVLWLDDYDEIYSDFDPRIYQDRELSYDFISETRRLIIELGNENIDEIKLLVPKNLRDLKSEKIIVKRINEYYKSKFIIAKKERNKLLKDGIKFIGVGFSLILLLHFYFIKYESLKVLALLLEPASWFSVWEGLHLIVFDSKDETPSYEFYNKIKDSKISFGNY